MWTKSRSSTGPWEEDRNEENLKTGHEWEGSGSKYCVNDGRWGEGEARE